MTFKVNDNPCGRPILATAELFVKRRKARRRQTTPRTRKSVHVATAEETFSANKLRPINLVGRRNIFWRFILHHLHFVTTFHLEAVRNPVKTFEFFVQKF